jgi:HAD superfamily hydrolase (TIGR01549 family)
MTPQSLPNAILFDMDGTLTQPLLDFARIKLEMAIGPGPILESLALLKEPHRTEAETILLRHEQLAAENSTLNPGCEELLAWLSTNQIPAALITRNSRASVTTVLRRHNLKIDHIITREDGPFKPNPAPLYLACQHLGFRNDSHSAYESIWMVGDSSHDVQAAYAANIPSIWISHNQPRLFDPEPWITVTDLIELIAILKQARKQRS